MARGGDAGSSSTTARPAAGQRTRMASARTRSNSLVERSTPCAKRLPVAANVCSGYFHSMEAERESEREVEETVISIHHHEDECCERGPRSADSSELEAPVPFASSLGASFLNLFAAKN